MIDGNNILIQTITFPIVFAAVVLVINDRLGRKIGWLALAPLLYVLTLLSYVNCLVYTAGEGLKAVYRWAPYIGDFILLADGLSAPIALTVALLSALVCIYSIKYMEHEHRLGLYFSLYLLYAAGMIGTVLAINLVAFFIFFEFMLLPSWALIGIWGTGRKELIALKYFMFTEAGALSILAGIAVTYSLTGTLNILELGEKTTYVSLDVLTMITLAYLLGFFVKMAIVPLHTWLPDAHAEAPTPISALLSPAMIGIGGYASIRMLYYAFPKVVGNWEFTTALSVLALMTMIYGGLMALAQTDIKRLLAYSSISQMGYMLFGIASVSIIGITGSTLLYVSHGLAKAVLFMVSGVFIHKLKTRNINDLRGLADRMPATTITTLIGFLSLAGVPPFLGFWSELLIFAGSMYTAISASIDMVRVVITTIAIVMAILTAGYGLWTIKRIFYGEPTEVVAKVRKEPVLMLIPIIILAMLTVLLGIWPTPLTKILGIEASGIFKAFP